MYVPDKWGPLRGHVYIDIEIQIDIYIDRYAYI